MHPSNRGCLRLSRRMCPSDCCRVRRAGQSILSKSTGCEQAVRTASARGGHCTELNEERQASPTANSRTNPAPAEISPSSSLRLLYCPPDFHVQILHLRKQRHFLIHRNHQIELADLPVHAGDVQTRGVARRANRLLSGERQVSPSCFCTPSLSDCRTAKMLAREVLVKGPRGVHVRPRPWYPPPCLPLLFPAREGSTDTRPSLSNSFTSDQNGPSDKDQPTSQWEPFRNPNQ